MRRAVAVLLVAAACTAPDYQFAATDAGAAEPRDSGTSLDADEAPDSSTADVMTADAQPLPTTAMPNGPNFVDDCQAFIASFVEVGSATLQDEDAKNHCVLFFHNAQWKRTWLEAKGTCETITRGAARGHLAVFPNATKAQNLIAAASVFPSTLAASIGLRTTSDATDKAAWTWVTNAPFQYDGWAPNHPAAGGGRCAGWAGNGNAQWTDVDCALPKGFLCEVDE